MDLTGHSTDFVADSSFPAAMRRCGDAAMRRFVRRRLQRRPGLFVCGEPLTADALADWGLPEGDEDGCSGIVTLSAGKEMQDSWEENGYALDASGEGPFSVVYRLHVQPLRARVVVGVESASAEGAMAFEGTGLLLSEYFAVSVVMPEDPASGPFPEAVLSDFVESFGLSAGLPLGLPS